MATNDSTGIAMVCTPQEIEVLVAYEEADSADQRRIESVLRAARADLLPPARQIARMSPTEVRALVDALPCRVHDARMSGGH